MVGSGVGFVSLFHAISPFSVFAAQTIQAEKELAESPPSSKRTSFPGRSESPVPKWPKMSDETKPEQVRS